MHPISSADALSTNSAAATASTDDSMAAAAEAEEAAIGATLDLTSPSESISALSLPEPAPTAFGRPTRAAHFRFSPSYTPTNHGGYGTAPVQVMEALAKTHADIDARPDIFMRYTLPAAQLRSRTLVADMLHCPVQDLVLVPNATTAYDCVLRNMRWQEGDVVVYYEGAYPAVEKALLYTAEYTPLQLERLEVAWPVRDDDLVELFRAAIERVNSSSQRRVRMLVFDTILSAPGLRLPWERLCALATAHDILSMVDGAHGIGHIAIDITSARPSFFATNLHKWLHVPRAVAAFYVAPQLQPLMRSSLPTSHGFTPVKSHAVANPVPTASQGYLADLFTWLATLDYAPYVTVPAALEWRQTMGGEDAIMRWCVHVAQHGAEAAAQILGTDVMRVRGSSSSSDSGEWSGRQCALGNVRLPLEVEDEVSTANEVSGVSEASGANEHSEASDGSDVSGASGANERSRASGGRTAKIPPQHADKVVHYLRLAGAKEHNTYYYAVRVRRAWWWRVSGAVYLDVADVQRAARGLRGLCARMGTGTGNGWVQEYEDLLADLT